MSSPQQVKTAGPPAWPRRARAPTGAAAGASRGRRRTLSLAALLATTTVMAAESATRSAAVAAVALSVTLPLAWVLLLLYERRRWRERLRRSESLSTDLLAAAPDAILCVDSHGVIVRVNAELERLSGRDRAELVGAPVGLLVPPRFAQHGRLVEEYLARPVIRFMGSGRELTLLHRDGHEIPVEISLNALASGDGNLVIAAIRDCSERQRAAAALARSERLLRDVTSTIPGAVYQFEQSANGEQAFRFLSDSIHGLLDLPRDGRAVTVQGLLELVHPADRERVREGIAAAVTAGSAWNSEFRVRTPTGALKWIRGNAIPAAGSPGCWNGVLFDVTETHMLSAELSHQAEHDGLTGLLNRRAFEHALERVIAGSPGASPNAVLAYLDLDQFKVINDTCGHAAGDELLRQLTALLKRHLRGRDVVARLGGDEFAIIVQGEDDDQALMAMARLRDVIGEYRFAWDGKTFSVGVSIGVVPIRCGELSAMEALKRADSACYAAKDAGRNRVHVFEEDDAALALRHGQMRWVPLLHEALAARRFELHAQPILALPAVPAQEEHFEILLRMRLPGGELVQPGAFMPSAERYGLAPRLDRMVITQLLEHLAADATLLRPRRTWNVNLSGLSLGDADCLGAITECLRSSGLDGGMFCFEITETAAISNLSVATSFIERMRVLGCRFALDDFGSGISSFGQLKTLAIDFVKIDGVFVRTVAHDSVDFAMVKAINEMSHVMGIRTVAEFVEDEATLAVLRRIGVDFAQGYAVGRPVPLTDLGVRDHVRDSAGRICVDIGQRSDAASEES